MNNIQRTKSLSDIVETGSNSYGNFVKYRNGIMECWGEFSNSVALTQQDGVWAKQISVRMPQSFIGPTYVLTASASGGTSSYPCAVHLFAINNLDAGGYLSVNYNYGTAPIFVKWRAIGKWTSVYDSSKPTISIGRGIIESASNANGSYVKYEDGTMECWYTSPIKTAGTAQGVLFRSSGDSWVFPQPFSSQPTVSSTANLITNGIGTAQISNVLGYTTGVTYFLIADVTGSTGYVSLRAIGRWQSATNMVGDYTYGQGIVETGSNDNGNWIKFDNGTLLQWGRHTEIITLPNGPFGTAQLYHNNPVVYNYPIPFVGSNPVFTFSIGQGLYPFPSYPYKWGDATDLSFHRVYIFALVNSGNVAGYEWQAVGRWK